jgi:hypothetical protein
VDISAEGMSNLEPHIFMTCLAIGKLPEKM